MIPSQISFNTLPVNQHTLQRQQLTHKNSLTSSTHGVFPKGSGLSEQMSGINTSAIAKNIYETENLSDQKLLHIIAVVQMKSR